MSLSLNEYQKEAMSTASYPGRKTWIGLAYTGLGLGEVGELQGKIKKILRDDNFNVSEEKRLALLAELGDVLWYVALMADELDCTLNDVAIANLFKLASRMERGVIGGSGDDR